MFTKIGLASLVLLVASEVFVMAEAVLWPVSTLLRLGATAQGATFALAGLAGCAAGVWIARSATRVKDDPAPSESA